MDPKSVSRSIIQFSISDVFALEGSLIYKLITPPQADGVNDNLIYSKLVDLHEIEITAETVEKGPVSGRFFFWTLLYL